MTDPLETKNPPSTGWRDSATLLMGGGNNPMTLPNWLTLTRIFMLPILVLFLLQGSSLARLIACGIFVLAALTDWLDGYLARKRSLITPLGEILDPLADKLLIMAALLPLVAIGRADSWVVGILLGREFLVTALRTVALRQGIVVAANWGGKVKMGLQVSSVIFLILDLIPPAGTVLLWMAMLVGVASGVDYFRRIVRNLA
jgi:CDP-diacylglycerol--glycerol-3-phosphate 3-phosphatidyltransferase